MYNLDNCSYIWYHSTLNGLVNKILAEGLKIYSLPTHQEKMEPYIYVSSFIFNDSKDFSTFAVDLSKIDKKYKQWPFNESWFYWQLTITCNIPPIYLTLIQDNR